MAAVPEGQALEILLNEYDRGRWLFRRDPGITRPAKLIAGRSADGVPFLRPEIVLLYKSKDPWPDDQADFEQTAPLLGSGEPRVAYCDAAAPPVPAIRGCMISGADDSHAHRRGLVRLAAHDFDAEAAPESGRAHGLAAGVCRSRFR